MTTRLTFPAPRRCSCTCGQREERLDKKRKLTINEWADHPWTASDVAEALRAGALFIRGKHDFANDEAEVAALGRKSKRGGDIRGWLKKLGPRELYLLREALQKEVES